MGAPDGAPSPGIVSIPEMKINMQNSKSLLSKQE